MGRLGCLRAGVTLVYIGQFHGLSGGFLHCLCQFSDLGAFQNVGRHRQKGQQMAQVSTAMWFILFE